MNKEEILAKSRAEYKNSDLEEKEASLYAWHMAARVGALICCIISGFTVGVTNTVPYSPWVIFFGILGTRSLITGRKLKNKTDLGLAVLYIAVAVFMMVMLTRQLLG